MTDFNSDKAIYLQMADRLCDDIMSGRYAANERIPSVREYAVMLQVNTNTAMKTYETLARDGVIYNKRGLGYFVAPEAKVQIMEARKREFREQTLPELFRRMRLLGLTLDDIRAAWDEMEG